MPSRPVLIVDDEPLIALLVADWLDELGYEVVGPAKDVGQALALIKTGNLSAAILDLSLRGEDSYSVADALLQRKIPFAFGTGRDEAAIEARFAHVPVLSKPYDLNRLKATVTKLLV